MNFYDEETTKKLNNNDRPEYGWGQKSLAGKWNET
jgi:hypothetical protein